MTHVATLVANPAQRMPDDVALRAAGALPGAGGAAWLDPGVAVDIRFTPVGEADNRILGDRVRAALGGACVDVVVQKAAEKLYLVRPAKKTYFQILRNKLKWGER